MALGYYFHPESMSTEQYDRVLEKLEEAGAGAPPGRSYHTAFLAGNGLHVFDVWESEAQFEEFGRTLMPILQAEGVDPGQPSVSPIHNVIVGS
jgi:hypothetical protein